MNKENLTRLADYLRAVEPERFDIASWLVTGMTLHPDRQMPVGEAINVCGTAACIAGHAVILFRPGEPVCNNASYELIAMQELGLNRQQAADLFIYWPREAITPTQAAMVVDDLARTGVVDWSIIE